MQKLQCSIKINAPKEKVWNTMLQDKTYRQWTNIFAPGSFFEGSWDEGNKMLFLDGEGNGMVSTIAKNKLYEFISIKHIGIINDGVEDTTSEEAKQWAGNALENYTFQETDGETEVLVEMDIPSEYKEMFEQLWPEALKRLRDIVEKGMPSNIVVTTFITAPVQEVWNRWTKPEHITKWNQASDDWHTPRAENDLREGGDFSCRMEAKDGSQGFEFSGTYTAVKEYSLIEYDMDDGRHVKVLFNEFPGGVHLTELFDPESNNSEEAQRYGWQAILDNFKKYVETNN